MVGDSGWELDTPCEGWSVQDLVHHVVAGNLRSASLASGARHHEAEAPLHGDLLGPDPVGAFDRSIAAQADAFDRPGALEQACDSAVGELTGRQLLRFRAVDLVVHAWDLSRALGTDESLDARLVEHTWLEIEPMVPVMASLGVFGDGPSGTLSNQATVQARVLDATGRRP